MANLRSIAKQAGVSLSTASRVLNGFPGVSEAARRAVLDTVTESGYQSEAVKRASSTVAVLYTDQMTVGSPFDAAILSGAMEQLASTQFDLMILDAYRSRQMGESLPRMLSRKGAQGVLVRTTSATQHLCRELFESEFPAVIIGFRPEIISWNHIYSDSRPASRDAVEHLIGLGHKRIAIGAHHIDDSDHLDRIAGYQDALEANGIPLDERLILRGPASREGGAQFIRRLISSPLSPTAIYLADPLASVGAMEESRRLGLRIPQDLSIVGFDDTDLRHCTVPKLTAVCQDSRLLGATGMKQLQKQLQGHRKTKLKTESLRCGLEIHESTGICAARGKR